LRIAQARSVDSDWLQRLVQWLLRPATPSDDEVRADLSRWVPEYRTAGREADSSPAIATVEPRAASGAGRH
jgi:hypothetical protein